MPRIWFQAPNFLAPWRYLTSTTKVWQDVLHFGHKDKSHSLQNGEGGELFTAEELNWWKSHVRCGKQMRFSFSSILAESLERAAESQGLMPHTHTHQQLKIREREPRCNYCARHRLHPPECKFLSRLPTRASPEDTPWASRQEIRFTQHDLIFMQPNLRRRLIWPKTYTTTGNSNLQFCAWKSPTASP